jgi:hypothetical protein
MFLTQFSTAAVGRFIPFDFPVLPASSGERDSPDSFLIQHEILLDHADCKGFDVNSKSIAWVAVHISARYDRRSEEPSACFGLQTKDQKLGLRIGSVRIRLTVDGARQVLEAALGRHLPLLRHRGR